MQDTELYSRLGLLVRRHRERLGMNQVDVARAVGLSRASIANIETGRQRLAIHHLYLLARALRVDVHALLPEGEKEPAEGIGRAIQSAVELSEREQQEVARVVGSISARENRGTG